MLAWASLFAGIDSIPMESHEELVVQTASEMSARGDWVMPYYNQEPRLKKPPLNYWMTMMVARLDPFSTEIQPWHGRACSMLGALLLLLAVAYAGETLHGPQTGFLAAALLLGSKGFADFSHHARPDFLYAVLSTINLAAWIGAWRAKDGSRTQWWLALTGWAFAGLATLSKGPQVPAIFLLGMLIYMLSGKDRRRILKVLHPFTGIPATLAIFLPWWLLLQKELPKTGIDLHQTQLSGSLLMNLADWKEILSFYYVFRLLLLLVPACLLIPFLIAWNRRQRIPFSDMDRLMLCICATTMVVFTIAGHYRPHYMLPVLPVAIFILANRIRQTSGHSIPNLIWKTFICIELAALPVLAGLLLWQKEYTSLVLLSVTGIAMLWLLRREIRESTWRDRPLLLQTTAASLLAVLVSAGCNAFPLRNTSRLEDRDFAIMLATMIRPADSLARCSGTCDIMPYYARHEVLFAEDTDELKSLFEQRKPDGNFYIVAPEKKIPELEKTFELTVLKTRTTQDKSEKPQALARILNVRP